MYTAQRDAVLCSPIDSNILGYDQTVAADLNGVPARTY